ncbi:lipid storage droplets surface-binding protein 1 [Halyomorpha halys]|uniref:lipid storage droplets surface-binding protein 1 n=1 Tax=Halyomorpha halys TaxID=286706 RepID=UPI0006D50696|nr:lipid storage droplets surface-binding protein 1 [Halyomorpha halys]XP_014273198.1 lipid storage droplets surface-binding protein 1 [Halyomorpha halys]
MAEKKKLPKLKSIQRISKIPVLETSFNIATGIYGKLKHSNRLMQWGFGTVEDVTNFAIDTSFNALPMLELPLTVMDNIVCKGLDTVQQRVPAINYPPEKILTKTKSYVAENIVQPVLKRADSVKQLGLNGAELAATRIDTALDVADKYVDKYLPDATDVDKNEVPDNSGASKRVQTIDHVNRLSRKLQRRLTKRTIAEAKALRRQGMDTAKIILKLTEMMIKDPKQFAANMKAVWAHLSEDEPENQIPPANLEQLIAMITRETARRFVHLTNFSVSTAYKLPGYTAHAIQFVTHETNKIINQLLKTIHLEGAKAVAVARAQIQLQNLNSAVREVQQLIENTLSKLLYRRDIKKKFQDNSIPLHTLSPVAQSPERKPRSENQLEPKTETNDEQKKDKTIKPAENTETPPKQNDNSNKHIQTNQHHKSPKKQSRSKSNSLSSPESGDYNRNNQAIVNGEPKNNTE